MICNSLKKINFRQNVSILNVKSMTESFKFQFFYFTLVVSTKQKDQNTIKIVVSV